MGTTAFTPRRLVRAVLRPVVHLHNAALYRMWCHPQKGILKRCHVDPFEQHGLGNLPVCAACKRPIRRT